MIHLIELNESLRLDDDLNSYQKLRGYYENMFSKLIKSVADELVKYEFYELDNMLKSKDFIFNIYELIDSLHNCFILRNEEVGKFLRQKKLNYDINSFGLYDLLESRYLLNFQHSQNIKNYSYFKHIIYLFLHKPIVNHKY